MKEGELGGRTQDHMSHSEKATARPMGSTQASAAHEQVPYQAGMAQMQKAHGAQSVPVCKKSIGSVAFL